MKKAFPFVHTHKHFLHGFEEIQNVPELLFNSNEKVFRFKKENTAKKTTIV
jgi:hypothetical protein